ncbi:response regulator transcription factor [Puteibacter caeruleilacunae]|nr:response regulator transcription factor [Puteibacter caeruleilacunae]
MKILLIEDEKKVSGFIKRGLENERYIVETANDGLVGLEMGCHPTIDLIILDLMLPGIDGLTVLRKLREAEVHTPVLILTAKDSIDDRIHGLNLGADDYMVKPFSFGELLARVRALLRRSSQQNSMIATVKDLRVNLMTHEVFRDELPIELTAKEYALLEFFINNADRAVNRISIAEHVWQYDFDPGTNFVDVYINRLRKKINDSVENKLIHTVRGYGYILKTK